MKLVTSIGPNPRVVTLFVAEKGLELAREPIDIVAGANRRADYVARNPAGGTPLLRLDDGTDLAESVAICEYLEELHPAPPLIGATPEERAETRMWVRRIDFGVVQPATIGFRGAEGMPMFRDRMRCVPEAAAGMKAIAQDGFAFLDAQLGRGEHVCGRRLTLADLLLLAFFDFAVQFGQAPGAGLRHLAAWHARMAARPSAAQ